LLSKTKKNLIGYLLDIGRRIKKCFSGQKIAFYSELGKSKISQARNGCIVCGEQ
jgi:hypothetical protein